MTEDEDPAPNSPPVPQERHFQSKVGGAYRPNLLLVSGLGLLIIATGMVLSNVLA